MGKETTQGKGGWFPSVIGPNEVSARHIPGDRQVMPTPSYDAKSMPLFRANPATADTEDSD